MEIVLTGLLCLKYAGARWTPFSAKFLIMWFFRPLVYYLSSCLYELNECF